MNFVQQYLLDESSNSTQKLVHKLNYNRSKSTFNRCYITIIYHQKSMKNNFLHPPKNTDEQPKFFSFPHCNLPTFSIYLNVTMIKE